MSSALIVLQGELTTNSTVVKLIAYDGNITQKKLGESTVRLNGVRQLSKSFLKKDIFFI